MEMSSFAVLLFILGKVLAATAIGRDANLRAQGHSGVEDPRRTDLAHHGTGYSSSEPRLLSAGNRMLGSWNYSAPTIALENQEGGSLHFKDRENYEGNGELRHVKLVIAIPSVRPDRRQAIRETWARWADDRVILRFFTESPNAEDGEGEPGAETVEALAKESMEHGDIIVQDIKSGMNFGLKLLWAMRWMSDHYSFDFFLRLDDDYFICLERLLDELHCFSLPGGQSSPIYAGYRACRRDHEASYVDESYILLSSVLIDRILVSSDLKCSGYGSLTAGAWLRIGGPGNPDGDVAFVNDYRLDRWGSRWGALTGSKRGHAEYEPVCEKSLGIHRTYPDHMYELWVEVAGRTSTSQSTSNGCDSLFQYEDDGKCPFTVRGVDDTYLAQDNVQPCDSFTAPTSKIYCGGQGC
ncbi:unnamed protein product [Ascophyllum nodosum]